MKVFIKREVLEGLLVFAGIKDVRYYFNSIHVKFSQTEATLIATDGQAMLIVKGLACDGICENITIPRASVEMAIKLAKAQKQDVVVLENSPILSIGGVAFTPIDGVFPDISRVIPKQADETITHRQLQLNPELLASRFKAYNKVSGVKRFHLQACSNDSAVLWDAMSPNVYAQIMGLRVKDADFTFKGFTL